MHANNETALKSLEPIPNKEDSLKILKEFFCSATFDPNLNDFKDEILKAVREVETNMNIKYHLFKEELYSRINSSDKQYETYLIKIDSMRDSFLADKVKIDKIADLSAFQKKASDQITSHDVKLNLIQKDLSNACYKYDKIFLDNLAIPGTIGDYCRFKNMKEYIENNITQVGTLMTFKEKHTVDLKNYKERLEGLIKQMTMQLDNTEKCLKLYTSKLIEQTEEGYKKEITNVGDKISDMRMENHKYAFNLQKAANDLIVEYDKVMNIKAEVFKQLEDSVGDIKTSFKDTVNNFDDTKVEFENIKKRFNDLAEFIKDVRFRKNLGVEITKKEIKKVVKNVTMNRKKDLPSTKVVIVNEDKKVCSSLHSSFEESKPEVESFVKMYIQGTNSMSKKKVNPDLKSDGANNDFIINEENEQSCNNTPINIPNTNIKEESLNRGNNNVIVELTEENCLDLEESNRKVKDMSMLSLLKNIDINVSEFNTNSKGLLSNTGPTPSPLIKSTAKTEDLLIKGRSNTNSNTNTTNSRKFKDKFPLNNSNTNLVTVSTERSDSSNNKGKLCAKQNEEINNNENENKNNRVSNSSNATDILIKSIKSLSGSFRELKTDIVKKLANSEKKLLEMEHHSKKKLEELAAQIKNFIPISFNAYVKNIDNNNSNKNIQINAEVNKEAININNKEKNISTTLATVNSAHTVYNQSSNPPYVNPSYAYPQLAENERENESPQTDPFTIFKVKENQAGLTKEQSNTGCNRKKSARSLKPQLKVDTGNKPADIRSLSRDNRKILLNALNTDYANERDLSFIENIKVVKKGEKNKSILSNNLNSLIDVQSLTRTNWVPLSTVLTNIPEGIKTSKDEWNLNYLKPLLFKN